MNTCKKQSGLTLINALFFLTLAGIFCVLMLRLFSPYMQNYKVKKILSALSEDSRLKEKSLTQIKKSIDKSFQVNDVENVKAANILMNKSPQGLSMQLDYEVRVHAISNIDAVVFFSHKYNF